MKLFSEVSNSLNSLNCWELEGGNFTEQCEPENWMMLSAYLHCYQKQYEYLVLTIPRCFVVSVKLGK